MKLTIEDLFTTVQMNTSRTTLVYEQTRQLADAEGDGALIDLIDAGLAAAREVTRLNAERRVQREGRGEDAGDDFDTAMDDAVRPLVRSIIDTHEYMERTGHPARARVGRLVATHFPVGPRDIIQQRYEEELHRVRALVVDLRGPYADLLAELEIERKLARVEALIGPYAEALAARRKVSADDVRAAARAMHRQTLLMVAHIITRYHADAAGFDAMMLPFADQQARIRAILRARRGGGAAATDDPSRDDDDVVDGEGFDEGAAGAGGDDAAVDRVGAGAEGSGGGDGAGGGAGAGAAGGAVDGAGAGDDPNAREVG